MKQYSGVQVLAFVVLLLGTGLAIISLATNHWSFYSYNLGADALPFGFKFEGGRRGLWEQCYNKAVDLTSPVRTLVGGGGGGGGGGEQICVSRLRELRKAKTLEGLKDVYKSYDVWEIACLVLIGGSAVLGVLALVVSPCLCARCGCCLSIFVLLAALCATSGISTYAYFHMTGKAGTSPKDISEVLISPDSFGYSFWCAVGAASGQLLASMLFAAGRGRGHQYSQSI